MKSIFVLLLLFVGFVTLADAPLPPPVPGVAVNALRSR